MYRQNFNRNCEQPNQWEGQHMQRMYPHSTAHCQPWHRNQAPWVQGSSSQNTPSQSARQRGGVQGSYSQNTPYHYQNVCDREQVQGLYSPNTHTQRAWIRQQVQGSSWSYSHDNTTLQQARHREQVRGSYSQNKPYHRAWDRVLEKSYPQNTTYYQQPLCKEQIQKVYSENTTYQRPWQWPGDQQMHGYVEQYPQNACTPYHPYNDKEKVQEKELYPQTEYNYKEGTLHAEWPYPQTTHPNTSSVSMVSAIKYKEDHHNHCKNTPGSQAHLRPESSTWNEEDKDLEIIGHAEGNDCGVGAVTAQVTNGAPSSKDKADKSDHAILSKEGPQEGQKNKFRCEFCPRRRFKKQTHLKSHMQDVHEEEKPVQNLNCSKCDKAFINNKALRRHMRLCRRIKCQVCGKFFRRDKMGAYRYHMAAHNGSVKDAHDQGTVSGTVAPSLATSVNSTNKNDGSNQHLTDKAYIEKCTCPICQKVCKSIDKMKRHLGKHLRTKKQKNQCQEGESKGFICKLCGMSFSKICRFQRHLGKLHKMFSSSTFENIQNLETYKGERIITPGPVQPTEFDHEMEAEQSASEPTLDSFR